VNATLKYIQAQQKFPLKNKGIFKNVSLLHLKQELQEVLKFPIEIFWNLEANLKSELLFF